jgi:hypothetical protein
MLHFYLLKSLFEWAYTICFWYPYVDKKDYGVDALFWNTPFRLGWILKSALLQTGRHADTMYLLFAIMLFTGLLSPVPAQLASGNALAWFWQGLAVVMTLTFMAGWMQIMHARTWLLMLDEAKHHARSVLLADSPSPCHLFAFAKGASTEATEKQDEKETSSPQASPWVTPLQRQDTDENIVRDLLKVERPCFLRPVITPFFQGIGRFWGRSLLLNLLQSFLLVGMIILPFWIIATSQGVPDVFQQLNPEKLEALANMSQAALNKVLLQQPAEQLQLISLWMMGLCIAMLGGLLFFLFTALWWPTVLVCDVPVWKALQLQGFFFRKDYVRALIVASLQVGLIGFFVMFPLMHSPNVWLNAMIQVGLFFGYLYSTHLAFIYVYSMTQPPFLSEKVKAEVLKNAHTLSTLA